MSVKIMGKVFDADLPRDEKYVLLSYADHAAHDGTNVYPAVERMSWKTGYTDRSIQSITKKLVARGVLVPDGRGPRGVNRWRIDVNMLPVRPDYHTDRGEKRSPRKKQQEGVKKTARKGEEISPNSSCNHQEPSVSATAQPEEPLSEEKEPERENIPTSKQSESEAGKVRAESPPVNKDNSTVVCGNCGKSEYLVIDNNQGAAYCDHCGKCQPPTPALPTDPPKEKKPNGTYLLAELLAEVCAMDFEANKGRLLREAKLLKKAKPPPSERLVRAHYGPDGTWYKKDFRGKRGEPPAPSAIRQTWKQYAGEARPEQKKTVPFDPRKAVRVYT